MQRKCRPKYDQAISALSNNQMELKTLILLQQSVLIFNESAQSLTENQKILQTRMLQIEQVGTNRNECQKY